MNSRNDITTIRPVEEKDLSGIREIYSSYYTKSEDRDYFINRVQQVLEGGQEAKGSDLRYLVADKGGFIVGILGFRKAPSKMLPFVKTPNPVELYTFFVRDRQHGVGRALFEKMREMAKESGYTEIVVFSSKAWESNWGFYDKMGFVRITQLKIEDGRIGQVWSMRL